MSGNYLLELAVIVLLGIGAQWMAWRVRLPSILLLLTIGFLAGPVTGHYLLNPTRMLGDLLMPVVSISVGLILFEGGLTLKFNELKSIGKVVRNLVTVGALLTWGLSTVAAYLFLGWAFPLSLLFGAILVVTGPTVIMPLLRHLQPNRQVGSILKWEGIVIDPIGAVLALLVFEAIHHGIASDGAEPGAVVEHAGWSSVAVRAAIGLLKTISVGTVMGGAGAWIIYIFFKRYWVPDYLQNPFSLMIVVCSFAFSNTMQEESGLLTVTLMGIILANQTRVDVRHVLEFKENLRVLLISGLFIVLSARLNLGDFGTLPVVGSLLFVGALMLVVRPACVWLSTMGSPLARNERVFLGWMAPRGIVAAAVASIFALKLADAGVDNANELVPVTFIVIVGTVLIYGLTSGPLARRLNVSNPNPQGVLIVGAHPLATSIGKAIMDEGFSVLLVDNNRENINAARLKGLPVYYGSVLSEHTLDELELAGIGRLLALTPNDRVNALAAIHFVEVFGRSGVFQLPVPEAPDKRIIAVPEGVKARALFDENASYEHLSKRLNQGAVVKQTSLTKEFDFDSFNEIYGADAVPLFLKTKTGELKIFTPDQKISPEPGQVLISLVVPKPSR